MRLAKPAGVVVAALAIASLAAACGGPPPSSPTNQGTTRPTTVAPSSSAVASAVAPVASSGAPSGGVSVAPGSDVVMDPGLLSVLPAAIGSAKVEIEPDSFGDAVRDTSFVASVDAAAFAIVTDGGDLASGVVAHLRTGVFSDAFFRDWRDSYDQGACAQAAGVAVHVETTLGARLAWITTCVGGLRTYHAWVPERGVVVSLISLGERRFGEQLLAGIRP